MVLRNGKNSCNKQQFLAGEETELGFQASNQIGDSNSGAVSAELTRVSQNSRGKKERSDWQIADSSVIGMPKNCPKAIVKYAARQQKNNRDPIVHDIRSYLAFLGWKIEYVVVNGVTRFRYTSPDGSRNYLTLLQICQELKETAEKAIVIRSNDVVFEPECCPEAIVYWQQHIFLKEKCEKPSEMILKAKKHLAYLDWSFWYADKGDRRELRYTSPSGVTYYSLRTACQSCLYEQQKEDQNHTASEPPSENLRKRKGRPPCSKAKIEQIPRIEEKNQTRLSNNRVARVNYNEDLMGIDEEQMEDQKQKKRRGRPPRPENKESKKRLLESDGHSSITSEEEDPCQDLTIETLILPEAENSVKDKVSVRKHFRNRKTMLSRLIEGKIVEYGDRVDYRGKGRTLKTGVILSGGIKCNCCAKIFALTSFEAHAGSTLHRPSANIFLEDGRSLFECQYELESKISKKIEENLLEGDTDFICSVCHEEGDLILCDGCDSCFHKDCLGLDSIPEGKWFCPLCCCAICHETKLVTEEDSGCLLKCNQCELIYHPACLTENTGNYENKKWFCSSKCEKIHSSLHEILGKPMRISGHDDIKLTLLQFTNSGTDAANEKKLKSALELMHLCFMPSEEGYTGRDLAEDVIFSRGCKLQRLNFEGFYTVILEKNKELAAVANLRICGEKVAELPMVGTRQKFRGRGMCRKLINKVEEILKEFGVERLVLPSVSTMLETWTNSFGFSPMTKTERAKFSNYNFLVFPETITCQKRIV
ncbi:hypothetical protein ACFE04_004426 [Oxalis oulophora]